MKTIQNTYHFGSAFFQSTAIDFHFDVLMNPCKFNI